MIMEQQLVKNNIQMTFAIVGIQILNLSIKNSPEYFLLPANNNYAFEIKAGVLVDPLNQVIGIDFFIQLFSSPEKIDNVFGLTVRMSYKILNFENVVIRDGSKISVQDSALHHLLALTVSTTRGILFEKVQGTFLSRIILPPIDVTTLTKTENQIPQTSPTI